LYRTKQKNHSLFALRIIDGLRKGPRPTWAQAPTS